MLSPLGRSVGGWVAGRREGDAFLSLLENIGDLPRSPSLGLSVGRRLNGFLGQSFNDGTIQQRGASDHSQGFEDKNLGSSHRSAWAVGSYKGL